LQNFAKNALFNEALMNTLINQLANEAFQTGATDLFPCEGQLPRVRIHSAIHTTGAATLSEENMRQFWQSCHADIDTISEKDTSYIINGDQRLRVNLYKSLGLLSAVLRPIKDEIPSMAELGAPHELLSHWMNHHSGLILVTGPTGSGKSTTMASALQWVNENQARHIVTIEDPIEYLFTNQYSYFSQRELHADTPSFSSALRAALRQSPDIILLGEIRDEETAKICLRAAETGHLVISTLHSSGVTDSLERLTNLFHSDDQVSLQKLLSQHLIGILCQKLLPRSEGGLMLAVEHFQNEAITRNWIRDGQLTNITDHLNRNDNPANRSFVQFLSDAVSQGFIESHVARQASPNPQDFDRLQRGISS
jgi:pilus retraction protein PilT